MIVTHNSAHVVGDLLESLPGALGDTCTQVVVVDNGSSDGTPELLGARADCTVIRASNDGYAAGINRGIRESPEAPAVLVLNPDVRLEPGSVTAMLGALRGDRGVVVPRVLGTDGQLTWSLRREPTLLRNVGLNRLRRARFAEYYNDPRDYVAGHVVDWAVGAVLLMSRSCYDAVGGWDESYFLYSEETDFMLAARDAGFVTWFEPSATAVHIGKQSGYGEETHSMLAVNRVRLYGRRHGRAATAAYFVATLLSEIAWLARGQRVSRAAIRALLFPRRRPVRLGCSNSLLPE